MKGTGHALLMPSVSFEVEEGQTYMEELVDACACSSGTGAHGNLENATEGWCGEEARRRDGPSGLSRVLLQKGLDYLSNLAGERDSYAAVEGRRNAAFVLCSFVMLAWLLLFVVWGGSSWNGRGGANELVVNSDVPVCDGINPYTGTHSYDLYIVDGDSKVCRDRKNGSGKDEDGERVAGLDYCRSIYLENLANGRRELKNFKWCDDSLSVDKRTSFLIQALTVDEKINQLITETKSIPRLRIPAFNYWTEGLHGVVTDARHNTTAFPAVIALAASWNEQLVALVGETISDELRALVNSRYDGKEGSRVKSNESNDGSSSSFPSQDMRGQLSLFTPNINIFRDPRWGRGQETFGEDPVLTSILSTALARNIQYKYGFSSHQYLKAVATAKHFAGYSFEGDGKQDRNSFNANISRNDFVHTYSPVFEDIVASGVKAVMCSYNAVNGIPACGNKQLLTTLLREKWGFEGYVVSDCGAISDFDQTHKWTKTPAESAAAGLLAGTDLNCGVYYETHLKEALSLGLVTEADIDKSLFRVLKVRFELGLFDPVLGNPYQTLDVDVVDSSSARGLSLEAAHQSIVLLENRNGVLPLDPSVYKNVAVIGPAANDEKILLGNYFGHPSHVVTPLKGMKERLYVNEATYAKGCDINSNDTSGIPDAIEIAASSGAVFLFLGLGQAIEAEGKDRYPPTSGSDLKLPGVQVELFNAIHEKLKSMSEFVPLVVVIVSGGPVYIPDIALKADAVLMGWYGGQAFGIAIANVLFGSVVPSGKLPVSIYTSEYSKDSDLSEMSLCKYPGKTYRYIGDAKKYIQYPFGYGLSYTTIEFYEHSVEMTVPLFRAGQIGKGKHFEEYLAVASRAKNLGKRAGSEVLQVYATYLGADNSTDVNDTSRGNSMPNCRKFPYKTLVGFEKIYLNIGEERKIVHYIPLQRLYVYDTNSSGETVYQRMGFDSRKDLNHMTGFYELEISGGFKKIVFVS
eukprot:Nk52_evm33s2356 gene=Nk52_evmTU33s2356